MTTAETLLALQELDLSLTRQEKELKELPELKELARKRAAHQKLTSEHANLMGHRKDLEFELEDIDDELAQTERAVTEAQAGAAPDASYRAVQDLELKLSDLAKQLDKLRYNRTAKERELSEAQGRETYLADYLAKFEKAMLADAERARTRATEIQQDLEKGRTKRERLIQSLDPAMRDTYERALKRHHGLAVERLVGTTPSLCRTALTESALDGVMRAHNITECPTCHRILIISDGEDA